MAPVNELPDRLGVHGLSKTFGRKNTVLRAVSLTVRPGEIHGLVGQNGSGKSTLIKLLSGFYKPDTGSAFSVDGQPLKLPIIPDELRRRGIAFVHQDLGLIDGLTVMENVRVGLFARNALTRHLDWPSERRNVLETFARLNVTLRPDQRVSELTSAQRVVVAIARALQGLQVGEGCIVLDESTQGLARETVHAFHRILRSLSDQGTSVLFVSHRLDEVVDLTHRVTVLRDGSVVASGIDTDTTSPADLTNRMLGRDADRGPLQEMYPRRAGRRALGATSLVAGGVRGIDLDVASGEVVGITGPTGSGFEEVPYLLAGVSRGGRGCVWVGEHELEIGTHPVGRFLSAGIALIPARRAEEGLALSLSVLDNMSLPRVRTANARWWLRNSWQHADFARLAAELGISPRNPSMPAARLSGGNQQKLLLAKWLACSPAVLVMHEPTQAVDVGARRDILKAIRQTVQGGQGVLIASMEAEDLTAVCDRILVMRDGRIVAELSGHVSTDELLAATFSHREAS